jgi:glycosyltransferase involved in cell wall biosynthesis
MKIAILASPFLPIPPNKYGGTERVIYFLVKGLMELGHEVTLFASGDSVVECELIPICDKAYSHQENKEKDQELEVLRHEAVAKCLDLVKENLDRFDVIHSHGIDLSSLKDFPNLTTMHGPITLPQMEYFEERKDLFYASISKNQQEVLPDLNYIGTVYNGMDPSLFPIVETPEDYLCFLGRFDREKNPHLAIQLALKLNMKLKLAGKIDFAGIDYFEQECKPHFENPLIEYLGEVDLEQKIKLLSNAKCNLHPVGFREPFGLTILEAAYCGTPTIAISRGSMSELIEQNRTGILVEDFDEGYRQIEDCFTMDRNYIAQRSRLLFNYKTMAKQYVLAYGKIIDIYKTENDKESEVTRIKNEAKSGLQALWESIIGKKE